MIAINVQLDVALEQFRKRRLWNSMEEQIDNSSLPAGSLMYFYCSFCGCLTDTLPEGYTCDPKTICIPCEVLHVHGLI